MEFTSKEVFTHVEDYLTPRVSSMNVSIVLDLSTGTMFIREKEGAPRIILMHLYNGWCCSFPYITSEQRKKVREKGFRLSREMGAYFWDISKPGGMNLTEIERLEARLLTLIKALFVWVMSILSIRVYYFSYRLSF